jgi:hypothetical protein
VFLYVVHNLNLYSLAVPAHLCDRSTVTAEAMASVSQEEDKASVE